MADDKGKLVYEDLEALYRRQATLWAGRNDHIDRMEQLRFMEVQPKVSQDLEPEDVRTAQPYMVVARMVPMLTANRPQIHIPPAADTIQKQKQSGLVENWSNAALRVLAEQTGEDVFERFTESLVAYGHGCMRVLYAPQLWAGMRTRGKNEKEEDYNKAIDEWSQGKPLPISWTWLDARNVFPMWRDDKLVAILEVDKREPFTLKAQHYNLADKKPELWKMGRYTSPEGGGLVQFMQLWTEDALIYAVETNIVHYEAHQYGRPPYVYRYGIATASRDRSKAGLSVLFPLEHLSLYCDRLLSQWATAIRIWAYPTLVAQLSENEQAAAGGEAPDAKQLTRDFRIAPGHVNVLYGDEKLQPFGPMGVGPDLPRMIELVMKLQERAGIADVLYGQEAWGQSGYAISQLIAAARTAFKPIKEHAESALEAVLRIIWDIVEYHCKQKVFVYGSSEKKGGSKGWIGIGPDDLQDYRQVQVTINPIMPTDEYARSSKALNERTAKVRSRRSTMEQIGIEDPDAEADRIIIEEWLERDDVKAWAAERIIRKAGIKLEEIQQLSPTQFVQALPTLPPAMQQALLMARAAGGRLGQQPGAGVAPVMGAPGVQAMPQPPTPQAASMLGPRTMPAGIATGQAPGVRRGAMGA